jgi:broad specificity phosphatase PhoE
MKLPATNGGLILVRHAAVAERYNGICYGRSDVPLGPIGEQQSDQLAGELAVFNDALVVHSGLQRARFLAERLAERLSCSALCCDALRERNFGAWELQSWDDIHAREGDQMLRMVSEPETYRPGGGETTAELQRRVVQWFDSLPASGLIIAVTHGGPIAALVGTQRRLPVADWAALIPRCGQYVTISQQNIKH